MNRFFVNKVIIWTLLVTITSQLSLLSTSGVNAASDNWSWVNQSTIEHTTDTQKETYNKVQTNPSLLPSITTTLGTTSDKILQFKKQGVLGVGSNPVGTKYLYVASTSPETGLLAVYLVADSPLPSFSNVTLSNPPDGGANDIPYIIGRTVYEGASIGNIKVTVKQIDDQGKEIAKYCIQPDQNSTMNSTCTTLSSSLHSDNESTNGIFRTAANLPQGKYILEVDQSAESFFKGLSKDICQGSNIGLRFTTPCALFNGSDAMKKILNGEPPLETEERYMAQGSVTVTADKNPAEVILNIKKVTISPLSKALSSAISTLGNWVQTTLSWTMGQIQALLGDTADYVIGRADGTTNGMLGPWTVMRNIGLSLLVIALILIAFANVLQIDIEQYGMNRMIPKIIISIFLAFTSWLIVTFFFDFTKAIQDQSIALLDTGGNGGFGGLTFLQELSLSTPSAGNILSNTGSVLLLIAILVGVLVCAIVLLFTLVMRIVMLSFLLAVAPLAFILNIVPFTSNLYKQWWSEFWKWMFMGPIAMVILSLGAVIAANAIGTGSGFGDNITSLDAATIATDSGGRLLIGLIIFAAAMYTAATLPMKWGGGIMKSWGKLGKNAWGKTGGSLLKAGGKTAWNQTGGRITQPIAGAWKGYTGDLDKKRQQRVDKHANTLLNAIPGGNHGMDNDVFEKNQRASILNAESKRYEFGDKKQFTKAYGEARTETAKQAIMLAGMRAGMLDDSKEGIGGLEVAKMAEADKSGLLMAGAMKDHREALITHGEQGTAQRAAEDVVKKFSTAKPGELKAITERNANPEKVREKGAINMGTPGEDGTYSEGIGKYAQGITQANVDKLSETQTSAFTDALTGVTSAIGGPKGLTPKNTDKSQQPPTSTATPLGVNSNNYVQGAGGLWVPKDDNK